MEILNLGLTIQILHDEFLFLNHDLLKRVSSFSTIITPSIFFDISITFLI